MSAPEEPDTEPGTAAAPDDRPDRDREELRALVDQLRSENERLRSEYARTRRVGYRRSAAALLLLGVLGVLGGLTLRQAQGVLLILGGIGLFGGALTWFLVPERFVTATVGESVYEAVVATGARLRDELGLSETSVYVPTRRGGESETPVRLFVPQSSSVDPPETPTELFVVGDAGDSHGVSVRPTAATLVDEFDAAGGGDITVGADPEPLARQLVEGLVEQFELVASAEVEADTETDTSRITVGVEGSAYGDVTGFDHPVPSFLGTGLARGLDRPVTVETAATDDRILVTCRWEPEDETDEEAT